MDKQYIPLTMTETDALSKEMYGRKASVAIQHRICIACQNKAPKRSFHNDEYYAEYLEDGMCQVCLDECYAPA